jgi:hypothetical protein
MPTDALLYFPVPPRERGRRFWHYAVYISLSTPVVFILCVAIAAVVLRTSAGRVGFVTVLLAGQVLTVVAGLVLAITGLVGGIRRRAWGMTALAGLGVAINLLIAQCARVAFHHLLDVRPQPEASARSQQAINVSRWEPVAEHTLPLVVRMPKGAKREGSVNTLRNCARWTAHEGPTSFFAECEEIRTRTVGGVPVPSISVDGNLDMIVTVAPGHQVAYRRRVEYRGQAGQEMQMEYGAPHGAHTVEFVRCFEVGKFYYQLAVMVSSADYRADPEPIDVAIHEFFNALEFPAQKL